MRHYDGIIVSIHDIVWGGWFDGSMYGWGCDGKHESIKAVLEKCPQSKTAFMLSCLPSHSPTAAHSNRTTSLRFPYYFSFTFLLSKSLAHSFSLSSHCRFRLSLYDSTARSLLADSHCILSLICRHYLRIILNSYYSISLSKQ